MIWTSAVFSFLWLECLVKYLLDYQNYKFSKKNERKKHLKFKFSRYIQVTAEQGRQYIYTIRHDRGVKPGHMGFNAIQRKQALLSLDQEVWHRRFAVISLVVKWYDFINSSYMRCCVVIRHQILLIVFTWDTVQILQDLKKKSLYWLSEDKLLNCSV